MKHATDFANSVFYNIRAIILDGIIWDGFLPSSFPYCSRRINRSIFISMYNNALGARDTSCR